MTKFIAALAVAVTLAFSGVAQADTKMEKREVMCMPFVTFLQRVVQPGSFQVVSELVSAVDAKGVPLQSVDTLFSPNSKRVIIIEVTRKDGEYKLENLTACILAAFTKRQ